MASLGKELKRERELRSISLQDIADQTKIGMRYLRAIENDRLDLLPGKFLTKAILKSFAQAIGVDADQVLNKFQEEAMGLESSPRSPLRGRAFSEASEPADERRPRRARLGIILAVLAVIVLVCVYFFVIAPRQKAAPPASRPEPALEAKPETTSTVLPEAPAAAEPVLPSPDQPLRLEIEYEAETWMQIMADGAVVSEGIRTPGTKEALEAEQEFVLRTGNAGGFHFTINGLAAKPLGESGMLRANVRIRRDNLRDYLAVQK
jgi:cytoskeletal protein RodZ